MKRLSAIVSAVVLIFGFLLPAHAQMPSYTDLTKLLVDLDGWEAEGATGMNMSGPMGEMVNALREYEKDGVIISAQIIVGGVAQGTWAPFAAGYIIDTPEVLVKALDVSGYNVGINHDKQENSGAVVVMLNARQTPAIFVLTYEKLDYKEALRLAEKFSWSGMEKVIE